MTSSNLEFGYDDYSFQAAGKVVGLTKLVDDFHEIMDSLPRAKRIRDMHPT